jgi:SAM-dependent methyltransferase
MPDQIDLSQMESVAIAPNGFPRVRRYWQEATDSFWAHIWDHTGSLAYWQDALNGRLSRVYERAIARYVKPGGKTLEAGCGLGQVVLALRARGFDCHGLDFAERTIELLRDRFPDTPFRSGDIRHLPYDDATFDAYLSFGVIEHFTAGQDIMLKEAARVLRPGGTIVLSVPGLNAYRRLRSRLGLYRSTVTKPFFEDCYSLEELKHLFAAAGLSYVDHYWENPVMTLMQESPLRPLYRLIEDTRYPRSISDRLLRLVLPKPWFGHMIMAVGR